MSRAGSGWGDLCDGVPPWAGLRGLSPAAESHQLVRALDTSPRTLACPPACGECGGSSQAGAGVGQRPAGASPASPCGGASRDTAPVCQRFAVCPRAGPSQLRFLL